MNTIHQTSNTVNSNSIYFVRNFPALRKKLRNDYGLISNWICEFLERLDHIQSVYGHGSWSNTQKQWADILGCSVRTFRSLIKIAEKELKIVNIRRECFKSASGKYIKQYRYNLNSEGLEKLNGLWRSKSLTRQLENDIPPEIPDKTKRGKDCRNIIVNHEDSDEINIIRDEISFKGKDQEVKKEVTVENYWPTRSAYRHFIKKLGYYFKNPTGWHNAIEDMRKTMQLMGKTFKGEDWTPSNMNYFAYNFINRRVEAREKYGNNFMNYSQILAFNNNTGLTKLKQINYELSQAAIKGFSKEELNVYNQMKYENYNNQIT